MIRCEICGQEMKGLTLHLLYKHKMKPSEYETLYPGAKMFADKVLDTAKRRTAFESMKGKPKSEEHRKKLSIARSNYVGWKHKPETIEKMRASWQGPNRESRIESVRKVNSDPINKSKAFYFYVKNDCLSWIPSWLETKQI